MLVYYLRVAATKLLLKAPATRLQLPHTDHAHALRAARQHKHISTFGHEQRQTSATNTLDLAAAH